MTQNYTTTAKGKKLDMESLKKAQPKASLIKNVKPTKTITLENKNIAVIVPSKLKATIPSSSPVFEVEEKIDLKQTISQLIKSKKAKGE